LDRRVEDLLLPTLLDAPTEAKVAQLSKQLRAEGKHTDARLLIKAVLDFAEPTAILVAEYILSTARDESIEFRSRLPELLSALTDLGWAGHDAPLEIQRALAFVFAEAGILRRDLTTLLQASERYFALSQRMPGSEAVKACNIHIHITNYVLAFCLPEDKSSPLTDKLIHQTTSERAQSQKRIADLLSNLPEHEVVTSTPINLQRALALALVGDDTRCLLEFTTLVDLSEQEDLIHETLFILLVAVQAETIRCEVLNSEPAYRDRLTDICKQIAKLVQPNAPDT
jgi:hypothetical protein